MVGTCDSGNECCKTVITKGFEQGIETGHQNTLFLQAYPISLTTTTIYRNH